MTKIDHEKLNRRRRQLLTAAAGDVLGAFKARYPGVCNECGVAFPAGTRIERDGGKFLHPMCRVNRALRQSGERTRWKGQSTPPR